MTLRVEEKQHRRKETLESGTRHHLAKASSSAAHASEDALAQPIVIECRKKNSRQESVVTHRFRKGKLLGKGGFAHCYKVTCVDTARPYAMKIVPKSTLVKSRARQKLQTEIKIHRTLQHPRVVRFEMFFEDRENVYILLELCTNHSLSELIRKTKRFTEEEARRYMLQILEATSYLHRHQIIHRDLKLGNVFLDRDWNIKMGDFGLATKLVQDSERKRTICGTPNYIAPEILEGKAGHSYQVDLWSAGVILYTMLVGRPPYESTDVKSTYRRILANVYAFPESVAVSDSAKNLVGRLLQVKPELRPSLDEILNHPFLRNGGPRQRFSTSHGLRGSSSASSSPPSSAVPSGGGGGGGGGCGGSTASRLGAQKHNTPERCAAGGFGRPPLKTRSSNVEGEAEVPAESNVRPVKPRAGAGASAATGKAGGEGGSRDTPGARQAAHGGPVAAKRPSSLRSAVPRTNSTKGFSIYCDAKEVSGGGGAGGRGSRAGAAGGGASSSGSKRGSPTTGGGRRREAGGATAGGATAGGGGGGDTAKSPTDKENDARPAFGGGGGGGGGGARVPVNGPISRRPIVRSASSVGPSGREAPRSSRARAEAGGSSGVGGAKGAAGPRRPASLRRSASAVATSHAEPRRASARDGGDCARAKPAAVVSGRERASSAAPAAAGAATPRARSSSHRGAFASDSPATPACSSTYRSPMPRSSPAAGGGGSGGRVSARTVAVGGGVTPRSQAATTANKGDAHARQRLDFGSTPRSTRQRDSPAASSRSSGGGGGGGGGGGKGSRSGRLASCPPASEASKAMPSGGSTTAGGRRGGQGPAEAATTTTTAAAAARGAVNPSPRSLELKRDTLENMHEVLAAGFAAGGAEPVVAGGGSSGRSGASRGTRASAAAAAAAAAREAAAAADEADSVAAPRVWVTRYVDYSSKYGLGFLLSDGSAGVYFNDATKMVLEPAGVAFEYIERARRSSPDSGGVGGAGDHPPRARHTLEDFPPELQKKVTLLNHFRGYLHELVKKSEGGSGPAGTVGSGAAAGEGAGGEAASTADEPHGQQPETELTFLRKWMRTRNAILFRLSNRTVQVVFSDHTEVLLSREARVVTFVDKDGRRETLSLQRVLQDQRPDITKRVRYSNELIAQLLRRA